MTEDFIVEETEKLILAYIEDEFREFDTLIHDNCSGNLCISVCYKTLVVSMALNNARIFRYLHPNRVNFDDPSGRGAEIADLADPDWMNHVQAYIHKRVCNYKRAEGMGIL